MLLRRLRALHAVRLFILHLILHPTPGPRKDRAGLFTDRQIFRNHLFFAPDGRRTTGVIRHAPGEPGTTPAKRLRPEGSEHAVAVRDTDAP